jgi:hypothetical protein
MRTSAALSPAECRAYSEGYYTALVYALRCLALAEQRFALAKRTRRRVARQRKAS